MSDSYSYPRCSVCSEDLIPDDGELCGVCARAAEERGRRAAFADPEALARRFHETYERLAPKHGYETRKESAVPWEKVPEKNRRLMIAVCAALAPCDSGKADHEPWCEANEVGPCECKEPRK